MCRAAEGRPGARDLRALCVAVAALRNLGFAGLDLQEIDESRARSPAERMAQEGAALLAAAPAGAGLLVVFDERGRAASSADFARCWRASEIGA